MEWFLIKAAIQRLLPWSTLRNIGDSFFMDDIDRKVWLLVKRAYESLIFLRSWEDLYVFAIREGESEDVLQRIDWFRKNDVNLSPELILDTLDKLWKEKALTHGIRSIEEKLLKGVNVTQLVDDLGRVYKHAICSYFVKDKQKEPVLEEVLSRMANYAVREKIQDTLLSGFAQLDSVLGGGYRRGTLLIWLGATSVGKTMMLIFESVIFALQRKNVLFISLEDNKDVVLERFDKLLFANVSEDAEQITKRIDMLKGFGTIEVMYSPRLSIDEFEDIVDIASEQTDVFVVDYGDLLQLEKRKYESDWVEQGEVFERMMKLADKYDKWVVTASQANREAVDRKVLSLSNIGRSYRKVQVADYVIALSQTKEEEQQGLIRLVVLKNKFGRRGDVIPLKVVREYGYFREELL
jgi:KaiC/GvpD/RAD55 family RecA-like ATPase